MFVTIRSPLRGCEQNASNCFTLSHDARGQFYLNIAFRAFKPSPNTLEVRSTGIQQQVLRIASV